MSDALTLVITRLLDAPREIVFAAWTDPEQATQWWGPKGFTAVSYTIEPRVGGTWRRVYALARGCRVPRAGRLPGDRRAVAPRLHLRLGDHPEQTDHQTLVTLTFTARGDKTALTLRQEIFETVAALDDHRIGWWSCLDRSAEFLRKRR